MGGILQFILWTIIIYYVFSFCIRLIAPILVKLFFKKMTNNFNQNSRGSSTKRSDFVEREKGDTTVIYKKDKKVDPGGDYVDYEELDED